MTKHEAFLRQAESDLAVYDLLEPLGRGKVPECHPLHYLQMASEKLAKAYLIRMNPSLSLDHFAFTTLYNQLARSDVAGLLGDDVTQLSVFAAWLNRARPIVRAIENTCPAACRSQAPPVARDDWANVEYPWRSAVNPQGTAVYTSPVDHAFGLLDQLRDTIDGLGVLWLIRSLMRHFDTVVI